MADHPLTLVLATANAHKVGEIRSILASGDLAVDLRPRPVEVPEVVEDAGTLEGNARLKAVALAEATGRPALADDTGLEVDVLDGAPGVESAYYGGGDHDSEANVARLLRELDGVAPTARTARFRTVVLVRWPDGREVAAEGVLDGVVVDAPRGEHGFGYDPVFAPVDGAGRTLAELAPDEKDALSHRGRALRALADRLGAEAP
ncbi:RdgB/HAM1 family non-canonical purine NTP pyrophosphatase [Iamia majanohamensis]|uniref:dITP/XTP pyrophosphatase n=1 Tax=Iamia majanohamensis TaxID=467976 RepID=A0AAF0BXH8_9ACTN|nr:RdgB/HAM1 family non-canonical purine NTP pyrophosphatase [Iamia majanohamensis]WCO68754.1 RdgB/HAM1 family non-canonical purine NTP pyrophosphatase [Iamia majanohamensis]